MPTRPTSSRRALRRLARLAIALGAIPLLAPTCGDPGEGSKVFARSSLIIPMDVCYQYQTDGMRSSYTPANCPQAVDAGDVIKAYGLVYELIRNDIAVYWVIDSAKTAINGIDLTIQYAGGFPVTFYDWTPENPPPASPPTAQHAIDYRGGPFVVDGSDYARASAVLQRFRSTFQNVNVHVSNVAFEAYAKRTMAGGWNAGGTIAPKVALLDIGSTSNVSNGYAKNSEPIIRGYLARAGLDFPGAGGVATDTGHGQIYDRLGIDDLLPSVAGNWTTTNLYKYGYQILWVPHWFAPGSCADTSSQARCVATLYATTRNDPAIADKVLATIGSFVGAGKDLFAECAGLGSFEGEASGTTGWSTSLSDGNPATHFHTTNGISINKSVAAADYDETSAASPLLQLGDYPFIPRSGAIQNFKPAPNRSPASTYQPNASTPEVKRLVTDASDGTWDYFTYRPPATGRGTTVYLGGHVYSGYADTLSSTGALVVDSGTFQIGGTRLVLNTLFNLGASCTSSGVACSTGKPGICAAGTIQCQGGMPVCVQTNQPLAQEVCNGLDDDCDWEVDEGLQEECYDYGSGLSDPTLNIGLCRSGVSSCVQAGDGSYGMSACVGQVTPSAEICNGLDDNCNGTPDEGLTRSCYDGPASSIDPATGQPRPVCQAGTQSCSLGSWGACVGQVLPKPEVCSEGGVAVDDDCNGVVNDGCTCTSGQTRACYTGPTNTAGVGICKTGIQTCTSGAWSPCQECTGTPNASCQVTPKTELCATTSIDENCDGLTPPCPECTTEGPRFCYPGNWTADNHPNAQCAQGTQSCVNEHWTECQGYTLPAPIELCDAVDNNCNGTVDEGAICPTGQVCLSGVCVPDSCGVEIPPPEGYACNPSPAEGGTGDANGTLRVGACGTNASGCPAGVVCSYGQCIAPCTAGQCAPGSTCGGGACIAGGCYVTGCPQGQLCREGACVADACVGALCPIGTFCRDGDCVQACTFVTCPSGQKCGIDGFCERDACAGVTCPPGERCNNGACATNPCATRGCADGQVCVVDAAAQALCVDDPCTGISCPAGACSGGQCYSTEAISGGGETPPSTKESGGCGCGSGGGVALPALLALLAAPLARRRRRGGGGVALLLAAAVLVASACKKDPEPFDPAACQETCGEQRCVDLASDVAHCEVCGNACAADQQCVDGECGPTSPVAPYVAAVTPTSGAPGATAPVPVRITGERFVSGAKARLGSGATAREFPATFVNEGTLDVSLDLSAVAEDSYPLRVVNPDRVISNAKSFLVSIPYPVVAGISPPSMVAGTGAAILVTGSGFVDQSECRMGSTAMSEVPLPSSVDAAGVHCTVDAGFAPGAYTVRIVNPGNRGSNPPTPFALTSGSATLAEVSPTAGPELSSVSLTLTGTGFDGTSRVYFDGCLGPSEPAVTACLPPNAPPIVTTTFVSPTTLLASLMLPDCATTTCSHQLSVRNGAGAPTTPVTFLVQSNPPAVATFDTSPAPPYQGDAAVHLVFQGTNFAAGATIEVQPPGGAFGGVAVTPVSATATRVEGTISLAGRPDGSYYARLNYGGGQLSAAWPFRVLSNQAILRDMTANPDPDRSGPQGSTKTDLTLEATNLRPPYSEIRVVVRGPGIATSLEFDPVDPTSATGNVVLSNFALSTAGLRETGNYAFTVRNPGGAAESNALTFVVTPGRPTVTSLCRLEGTACAATNPTSASQQSAPVPVRITGTNFAKPDANGNGSTVMVTAKFMLPTLPGTETVVPAYAPWNLCPAAPNTAPFQAVPGTVEVVSATEIVVQLDTLSALALPGGTPYYVAVWNPGGPQKSNGCSNVDPPALPSFTVFP